MPDVYDKDLWNQRIMQFKNFSDSIGAEFKVQKFPNGKEVVVVQQYHNPLKKEKTP